MQRTRIENTRRADEAKVSSFRSEEELRAAYAERASIIDGTLASLQAAIDAQLESLMQQLAVAGDESLAPASSALAALTSHFNRQQTELTVRELPVTPPAPPVLPGQPVPPAPPSPDWKHYEFQYQSLLPPAVMLQDLAQPGLRLREIKTLLQSDQLAWSVTGDLYVK